MDINNYPSLPKGWVWTRMGEIVKKVSLTGKKLKQSEYQEKGGLPVIDQGQSFIGGYTNRDEFKISPELPIIIFGDHTKVVKYVDFEFVAGADGVKVIKPLEVFYPKLFYYFLQAIQLPDRGYARHFQFLEKSSLPLPPLPEQHRIVAKIEEVFTKLDAGVEALKKVKVELKRYRQAVLKYAFEGKLTEEWRKANKDKMEPASILLERIKAEMSLRGVKRRNNPPIPPLGKGDKGGFEEIASARNDNLPELPEGWAWTRVKEIVESMKNGIYKQRQFYSINGIACLRMYNIEDGSIVWKDIKRMNLTPEEIQEYELKPGDILVNRVNSRELVGKAAPISLGLETCVFESKNIRLRILRNYVESKYVSFWFQVFSQQYFNRNAQQTVGMASINQEQLGSMPIPLPPLPEQHKIVEEIERRFSVADEVEKVVKQSLKQAERLRQSILKRAFEGKLVPQDPTDEPAEKLLERIKAEKPGWNQAGKGVK